MYPQTYLSLFPAFPRSPRAFVAMSFAPEFTPRWQNVLAPALGRIEIKGTPLSPFRVDLSKAGDAILTEILQAISDSAVIVGDVTAIGELNGRPVRNANVLYEVGIAHTSRRPEEVILFRSDNLALDFDVQGVRVHSYNPDGDASEAAAFVGRTVVESLRSIDTTRLVALRHAAQRLTQGAFMMLLEGQQGKPFEHPPSANMGDVLGGLERVRAIELLLELGAIETIPFKVTKEILEKALANPNEKPSGWVTYELTAFGKALADYVFQNMLPTDPAVFAQMKEFWEAHQKPAGSQR
jgi:hypothetical protein